MIKTLKANMKKENCKTKEETKGDFDRTSINHTHHKPVRNN